MAGYQLCLINGAFLTLITIKSFSTSHILNQQWLLGIH